MSIQLEATEETMLVPLFARAVESGRKRAILRDPKAVEMVASIPWDYEKFNQRLRVLAVVLRTAIFDEYVRGFLARHPDGTVVEIGTGLNTRFERLDNGTVHWFDLDLPRVIELRRRFFEDTERRRMVAASVLEDGWIETVRRSPGPHLFVAETVLVYLEKEDAMKALAQIARSFPEASVAFDTATAKALERGNADFVRREMPARFRWSCEDPREIDEWGIGLRLVESRGVIDVPDPLRRRLPAGLRAALHLANKFARPLRRQYRLNLYERTPQ